MFFWLMFVGVLVVGGLLGWGIDWLTDPDRSWNHLEDDAW